MSTTVYFIENMDTNEWYTHFKAGDASAWRTTQSDYWTRDPHEAFPYESIQEAQRIIDVLGGNIGDCTNLEITEHEFSRPSSDVYKWN